MITDAIITVFCTVIAWLIGLLPSWTAPDWLTSVTTTLSDAMSNVALLSGWVPIAAIGNVVFFLLAASAVAMALKIGRMVVSLFTGGGGSAA